MKVNIDKIRAQRSYLNLNQEVVAESLGYSKSRYAELEKDSSGWKISDVDKIARILKTSPLDLLSIDMQDIVNGLIDYPFIYMLLALFSSNKELTRKLTVDSKKFQENIFSHLFNL